MGIEKPPVRMMLDISQETFADLLALGATGLFGRGPDNVAEGFIRDRVRQCVLEGWLPMPAAGAKRGR